jgi:hypothetical protein
MRPGNLSFFAGAGTAMVLLALTGCNRASVSAHETTAQKAPPPGAGSVTTDPRIPAARRAELERTLAAQQAGINQINERMKAAPQPKH